MGGGELEPTEVVTGPSTSPQSLPSPPEAVDRGRVTLVDSTLAVGATVGRYVIVARLGAGAMGVVYMAYDPKLDRRIALKLLQAGEARSRSHETATSRLIREARLLARLSHPNVVAVYDADTFGDQVYIAMEYVEGMTLGAWLSADGRGVAEIVAMFAAAGHGLAAAHQAGLVHRDFKPENVLVGADGRPRVVDFGIARDNEPTLDTERSAGASDPRWDAGDLKLTRTGALVGTPAYMSPEQHLGLPSDARSDQFSFCVALWEALWGQRPFPGETPAALAFNVTSGSRRSPPAGIAVPLRVRRALEHGLAVEPERRFADMLTLLAELAPSPAATRWRTVVALAVVACAGSAAWVLAPGPGADMCSDMERHLEGVWDADRRGAVEAAFSAARTPYAAHALGGATTGLSSWAHRWLDVRRERCEATHVYGEQSVERLDRAMACLDRQLVGLSATIDVLAQADVGVVQRAQALVDGLPDPARCADPDQGHAGPEIADGPEVARIHAAIARVRALHLAGRYADADELLARTRRDVDPARPDLVAQLALEAGVIRSALGDAAGAEAELSAAVVAADRAGWDEVRGVTLARLAVVLATFRGRPERAEHWIRQAQAALERARAGPEVLAEVTLLTGHHAMAMGRPAEAAEAFERALELRSSRDSERIQALSGLATARGDAGDHAGALAAVREALEQSQEVHGPDHPVTADVWNSLGVALKDLGRPQEAQQAYETAIAVRRAAIGADDLSVAQTLENLAILEGERGQVDRALARYDEAAAIHRRLGGDQQTAIASLQYNAGVTLFAASRLEEALARFRLAAAAEEKAGTATEPGAAATLAAIGSTLVELGRPAEALAPLERSLAIWARAGVDHPDLAEAQFALARALPARARERATALAREAKGRYAARGDAETASRIDAWLAG
jgi:tetratricopeptide (TPR) repeat protein